MSTWAFQPGSAKWVSTQWPGHWHQDEYSTAALHLRGCPSCAPSKICVLIKTVAWQMAMDCLEERAPISNSHIDTLWAHRERPWGCPWGLCLLAVGHLTNGDLWSHLGLLPLSLLLSIFMLKLGEAAFVGSFLTYTYCTLLAKVLRKQLGGQFESRAWQSLEHCASD